MNLIENYCLYYIPKSSDTVSDMLMVFFGGNKIVNKRELNNKIITLKNHDEVIGYAILEFSSLCKIKAFGTIFLPNEFLIKIINDYLSRNNIEVSLKEKEDSGFIVGRIISHINEEKSFIYDVDIKEETLKVESTFEIADNTLVVIAKNNTYLLPGRMISPYETKSKIKVGGRICTYEDLQMEVSNPFLPVLILEDDLEVGQDFYLMEEKINA